MKPGRTRRSGSAARAARNRTPFQAELIRLLAERRDRLGTTSGRALSERLGKSSNHLWQILNRGMVPSGVAVLDIARLLSLTEEETEALVLSAIETKARTRSRDRFWIQRVREMVGRRDAEIALAHRFLDERGLGRAFRDWRAARLAGRRMASKTP
jgi:hypothetical protein